ncbi:RNA-directed DNA polymerase, eukaryota, reverse transcriptase zinc-binding domain protein [Tanacetum coccineum]
MDPSLHLSHLFYADDVVFMGHWSDSNIDTIVQVLECFYRASGLRINMNKSKLMRISVANAIVDQAAEKIDYAMLEAHFSYLGSKVGGLMSRVHSWNEIVNNLVARLSNLKMETLSIGGRLTLLKSVSGSMPIYHMSLFKVSMKVLQRMESIRCHFVNGVDHNGKKTIWVKWSKVLASKKKGGIHGEDGKLGKNVNHRHSFIWLDMVREMEQLENHGTYLIGFIHKKMGNVADTSFWEDVWRGGYEFLRIPRGCIEQFLEFLTSMDGVALVDMKNRWVWSLDSLGEFSVAYVRRLIDERWLPEVSTRTCWIKVVPIKVNVHAWKVKLDCLPTRLNIS